MCRELGSKDASRPLEDTPTCPECGSPCWRDGFAPKGKQRMRCVDLKSCGRRFVLNAEHPKHPRQRREQALNLWRSGQTVSEIARSLSIPCSTISRWVNANYKRRREERKNRAALVSSQPDGAQGKPHAEAAGCCRAIQAEEEEASADAEGTEIPQQLS